MQNSQTIEQTRMPSWLLLTEIFFGEKARCMQIITTHKGADFDAAASVLAAKILYPKALAVLPNSLNPNIMEHKDMQECIRKS